ncbi:hypothetical protein RhiirA4_423657 [Rhizophagus irregularis]|uniref:Uncharacterized protein n=1 Tax=Rhizophagus irregularis TaxID=588596 RepID=A0A2I1GUK7_9GLOM|nr:hypothetical protein RhiirA4_423655 [Rhizophagus irregularis]PKY50331.1 hypothetical protein RhiirA4_423657 [Rhizophagus irregularis]
MEYLHDIGGHFGKKILFLFALLLPGYSCEAAGVSSVQSTPSAAINEVYKNIFQISTGYNGQAIMGFDNEKIVEELLEDIEFCPFMIDIQEIYKETKILTYYEGNSPEEVWKFIGILKKYGEIQAWRHLFKAAGCTEITPNVIKSQFSEVQMQFWTKNIDPTADKEILEKLHEIGLLCLSSTNQDSNPENKF